jgi:hypothetical protein
MFIPSRYVFSKAVILNLLTFVGPTELLLEAAGL